MQNENPVWGHYPLTPVARSASHHSELTPALKILCLPPLLQNVFSTVPFSSSSNFRTKPAGIPAGSLTAGQGGLSNGLDPAEDSVYCDAAKCRPISRPLLRSSTQCDSRESARPADDEGWWQRGSATPRRALVCQHFVNTFATLCQQQRKTLLV